jgi:hypothetical protein
LSLKSALKYLFLFFVSPNINAADESTYMPRPYPISKLASAVKRRPPPQNEYF